MVISDKARAVRTARHAAYVLTTTTHGAPAGIPRARSLFVRNGLDPHCDKLSRVRFIRRQDLEDMLVDPNYFQAVLHSLEKVKAMYQSQTELSMANEVIARMCLVFVIVGAGKGHPDSPCVRTQSGGAGTLVSTTI